MTLPLCGPFWKTYCLEEAKTDGMIYCLTFRFCGGLKEMLETLLTG